MSCRGGIIRHLSFFDWLISLNHYVFRIHPCCNMSEFPSFLNLHSVLLYVYTTFCLPTHLSVVTWVASISWLLWICCCEHGCMNICLNPRFQFFFGKCIPQSAIAGSCGNFLRILHTIFHSSYLHFTFLPAMRKYSIFSTSLLILVLVCICVCVFYFYFFCFIFK